jgi:transposase
LAKPAVDELSREELLKRIAELQRQNAELREQIEQLKRSPRRQAAPFAKASRVANPKRPGRKAGHGVFQHRQAPSSEPDAIVNVPAPGTCPHCSGAVEPDGTEIATTTEVPEQPKPLVTQYRVNVGHCKKCGRSVRGTAPGLAPDQFGATAHRVGASVMAAAHALHYSAGVPQRKVPRILKELTGVTITQSALTQDALRRAQKEVGSAYQQLRQDMRQAPFIHTDDTGWRVGGQMAFLMGFDSDQATVYQIRSQHRNEEVREVIPADYGGVMITDRGKSYEAAEMDGIDQQKCLAHLLRNIKEVTDSKSGQATEFGFEAKALLQEGIALWKARGEISEPELAAKASDLDDRLTHHLRDRELDDPDNQRLLDGIGAQQEAGRLLRFLVPPFVEPTNNRAERALRPAVIARKVSHCSKNQQGADAFTAFASIAQTAIKNGATSVSAAFRQIFSR